ncbi:MAG: alpha/beta fold hydrolase, partial [Dermatophilaceae bacterium]
MNAGSGHAAWGRRGSTARRVATCLVFALFCAAPAAGSAAASTPALAPATGARLTSVPADESPAPEPLTVAVAPEPGQSASREPVRLDAAVYRPADAGKHPAVVLAHGFGGSRADSEGAARELAAHGYLAVAYSARGFGASEGLVHLDDPDVEVADARAVITAIGQRDDVQLDAPGDPRVGVSGASYGGALALMVAGSDPRVDAVVAAATWNDLAAAFYPSNIVGADTTPAALDPGAVPGVLKRRWLSGFFSGVAAPRVDSGDSKPSATPTDRSSAVPTDPTTTPCGRFEPTLCAQFLSASASTRPPPAALVRELHRRSPAVTNERVTAPTLLVQGLRDSLFGLDHADANARQIAAAGTPVAVRWFEGGHDGGAVPSSSETLLPWFDRYLRDDSTDAGQSDSERRRRALPVAGFTASAPAFRRGSTPRVIDAPRYPGLPATGTSPAAASTGLEREHRSFADAPTGTLLSPPGGDPAATITLPGLGRSMDGASGSGQPAAGGEASGATVADPLSAAAYALAALPGQSVAFDALPGETSLTVVGAPRVRLTVTSSATDATFFVSLWKVVAGTPSSPRRLVAPVRVATRPGVPTTVDVALPAGTYAMEQGSTWRVLVSATDAAYATPTDARVYRMALAGSDLLLPVVPSAGTLRGRARTSRTSPWR